MAETITYEVVEDEPKKEKKKFKVPAFIEKANEWKKKHWKGLALGAAGAALAALVGYKLGKTDAYDELDRLADELEDEDDDDIIDGEADIIDEAEEATETEA